MRSPRIVTRVGLLSAALLIVFAALFLRLWALQVLSGDSYLAQANDNRVRTLRIEAPRGVILDRNGRVLVENTPGTRVERRGSGAPTTRGPADARRVSPVAR